MKLESVDTRELNLRTDLLAMAQRYTTMRRESAHEWAGSCPKCGGEDRFHVKQPPGQVGMWFCRHCYDLDNNQPHDAIAFVRWMTGLGFQEAVGELHSPGSGQPWPGLKPTKTWSAMQEAARRYQPGPVQPEPTQRRPDDPTLARLATLHATCRATFSRPDNPGYLYAIERGFTSHVLSAFHVGFHADAMGSGPALVLPYYRGGQVWGLHYRYITPGAKPKYKHEKGSSVAGILFGGHTLATDTPELLAKRTLFITEGELNAMSIWQVAEAARVDVLSLGSESATLTPAAVKHAQKYRACIVWCDKEEIARRHAATIGCAAYWSDTPAGKRDANDLLQTMELRSLVADLIRRASPNTQAVAMDLKEIGA